MVMNWRRLFRHLFTPPWRVRQVFPAHVLRAIEEAVNQSENNHEGQIRVAVEAALDLPALLRGQTAGQRAVEVFSQLRVWDTERNNGVLIYLLLADHDVEIIADRGIHAKAGQLAWREICGRMEQAFRQGKFLEGTTSGIQSVGMHLAAHYPQQAEKKNELPNSAVIL
jgi:uncharacterized membrane protein